MDFTLNIIVILVLAQVLLSAQPESYEKSVFSTYRIRKHQEYYRILSSAFIHSGWMHLFVNAFAIYNFSPVIVQTLSSWFAATIFFISILGSSLTMLWMKRNMHDYQAVGASGGVSGLVMFAFFLYPEMNIGIFLIPVHLPAFVFGILFSLISVALTYVKNPQRVAHEGHLGGLLAGGLIGAMVYGFNFPSDSIKWLFYAGVLPIGLWMSIPLKLQNRWRK